MSKAVVVAHPDDEVLWAGGFLLQNPGTTVICCSVPRHDSIRAWKFFDACYALGAKPRLIPSTEASPDQLLTHLDVIDLSEFDLVVTHNSDGEYGHLHHQCVHEHIVSHWKKKKIWTFGYRKDSFGNIKIQLTPDECNKKLEALKKYNHLWPYNGSTMPKWEALMHRYMTVEGIDFTLETFNEHR